MAGRKGPLVGQRHQVGGRGIVNAVGIWRPRKKQISVWPTLIFVAIAIAIVSDNGSRKPENSKCQGSRLKEMWGNESEMNGREKGGMGSRSEKEMEANRDEREERDLPGRVNADG